MCASVWYGLVTTAVDRVGTHCLFVFFSHNGGISQLGNDTGKILICFYAFHFSQVPYFGDYLSGPNSCCKKIKLLF